MNKKRLLSLICIAVMLITAVQIPAYAAEIVRLDLSKNQTVYTSVGDNNNADSPDSMTGTIVVNAVKDDGTYEALTDGLEYSSSDTSVVTVDEDGEYTILKKGMSVITVKYGELESSMVFYRTDEKLVRRTLSTDKAFNASSQTTQMPDPVYTGENAMTLGTVSEHNNTMVKPNSGGTFATASYATGMWIYDFNDQAHQAYFGFGGAYLKNGTTSTAKTINIKFGAASKTDTVYKTTLAGIDASYTRNEEIPRKAGWHHVLALVSHDEGTTNAEIYFDGVLASQFSFEDTIIPKALYAPNHPVNSTTSLGMPFKERVIARMITGEAVTYDDSNTADGDEVLADHSFEYTFSGAIDLSQSSISAVLTDTVVNDEIDVDVKAQGNKLVISPKYPLVAGRNYNFTLAGNIVSLRTIFVPSATVENFPDNININFSVEKAASYAENSAIDDEAEFSADVTGDAFMVVSQFGEGGVIKALSATEDTASAFAPSKNDAATRFEGYVVSSINEEEVFALASPAFYGADTRVEIDDESNSGTYADLSYNTETEMVEVHIASKTKYAGLPVVIRIMNKGEDYTDATESNFDEIYNRFEVVETDADGRIDYSFKLVGDPGKYDAIINIPFDEAIEDSVSAVTEEKILKEIGNIQNATPETAEEVFSAAREFIDINYDAFDALTHQSIVYAMLAEASDCEKPEDFEILFEECVTLVKALEESDTTAVINNRYQWEIDSLSVYNDYIALDDTSEINEAILEKGFISYTEFSEAFAEATMMYLVRNIEESSEIYGLLKNKDDIAEIDLTEYEGLSFLKREAVDEIVYDKVFAEPSEINSVAKLIEEFCAAVAFVIENSATDAIVTGIDISQNKTMFADAAYKDEPVDAKTGTLKVYAEYNDGDVENISGDGGLIYTSSDESVVEIDDDGNYEVKGNGAAVITVKYGDIVRSAVFYHTPTAPYDRRYVAPTATSSIKEADDPFYIGEKAMMLDSNNVDYHNVGPSWNSYAAGVWVYDNGSNNDAYFGLGSESSYIYYGAKSSHGVYEIRSVDLSVAKETTSFERKKGWHQIYMVASYDALSERTNLIFYFDGQYAGKASFAGTKSPKYIFTGNKALFKERYIAELTRDYEFGYVDSNLSGEIESEDKIEFNFNAPIKEAKNVSVTLTDTENQQNIEANAAAEGTKLIVSPEFALMKGKSYSIEVSAQITDGGTAFVPSQTISFTQSLSFETKKGSLYAEGLGMAVVNNKLSFSANVVNTEDDVYMIASQFDADGISRKITASKVAKGTDLPASLNNIDKDSSAVSFEGYVWSGINKKEIFSLSDAASYGTAYERATAETKEATGSYADVQYLPDRGYAEIHVASKTKRKGIPVLIRVINPNKNYEGATEANFNEIYNRVEQLKTGENGKLDYKFKVSGDAGEYKVIVNMLFDEPFEDSLIYAEETAVNAEIIKVQSAPDGSEATVFNNARKKLDLNYTDFDKLTNKDIVYKMLKKAPLASNFSEFSTLFDKSVEIVKALEENDLEKIKAKSSEWKISSLSIYSDYIALSESDRKAVDAEVLNLKFSDYDGFKASFTESMLKHYIRKTINYSELYPLISRINDALEIDLSAYNALSSRKQGRAMQLLANSLSSVTSVAKLQEELNKAAEAAKKETSDGGFGGGGGGGGGGSSSGGLKGGSGGGLTQDITGNYEIPSQDAMGAQTPEWVEYEKMLRERKVFDDIESVPWAEDSIRELYNLGVISGKAERVFAPNDYVTREEICKMLVLAVGLTPSEIAEASAFSDVVNGAWYAPFVDAAYKSGIVNGKSDTVFGTGAFVTREELCTLADRAAMAVGVFLDDEFTIRAFYDEASISSWALNSVRKMRESFIVSGMGGNLFNPAVNVTRAQAAKIIYGVVQYSAE